MNKNYSYFLYHFLISFVILTTINPNQAKAICHFNESAEFLCSDTEAGDYFGYSIDISADRAVIGAYRNDEIGYNAGAVYVFRLVDSDWIQEAKLTASDAQPGDWFGWSVAISGNKIVVGANGDTEAGAWTGSAYIFNYNGTQWIEQTKLLADGIGYYWEEFGFDIAISADSNTVLVGACKANDNGFKSGAAYVFRFNGTDWVQQAKLLASDGVELATFANGVAISDNGNTALLGAPGNDTTGYSSGSVYVFAYDGNDWTQTQKLVASDATHGDHLGQNLAVSGNTAVIGAYGDDNAEPNDLYCNSGSAYVFDFNGTKWVEQAKLHLPEGQCLSQYGWDVDIYDDTIVIGAPDGHWGTINGTGHAYVYSFNGLRWLQTAELNSSEPVFGDHFGWSVAVYDNTVAIGAELSDKNGIDSGGAYIYDVNTFPGDFDCNNNVDYFDLFTFASAWLTTNGDALWNPYCDINIPADDFIDMSDLSIFAEKWLIISEQ